MPQVETTGRFKFFGNLKDFLERRNFQHTVKGRPSIKDTIEALGVPHTEVGRILVNGRRVNFSYQHDDADSIEIYPHALSAERLPRFPRFVLDSHLGKLARHLRLLGFDTLYRKEFPDPEIVVIAKRNGRIVLTRDIGLLKNKAIRRGYWIRSPDPTQQIKEVLKRFGLARRLRPFSRCLECNGKIRQMAKTRLQHLLPEKVKMYYNKFYQCSACRKVYWQGSHYAKLVRVVKQACLQ